MSDALVCLCTCPDEAVAVALGRQLVATRLAACVNLVPGLRSIYRWQGDLEEGTEVLLIIKTTTRTFAALAAAVRAAHPYELPELIAVPITHGSPEYLAWLSSAVA